MSGPDLDELLRAHYDPFRHDHARLRQELLDRLAGTAPAAPRGTRHRLFNRSWVMRLSAAAVVAMVVGVPFLLRSPGSQGLTWGDVVKEVTPVETVQYRSTTIRPAPEGAEHPEVHGGGTVRVNYETVRGRSRTDSWTLPPTSLFAATQPSGESPPEATRIWRRDDREAVLYEIEWRDGRPRSIRQSVSYVSPHRAAAQAAAMAAAGAAPPEGGPLAAWRTLLDLPPEAVLKRGYEEVDGARLLKFEVVAPPAAAAGLAAPGTLVWVDPATRRPVVLQHPEQGPFGNVGQEAGTTRWSDIRINETVPDDLFDPPPIPDDIDAEVSWHFELPMELWERETFTFRVFDPDGRAIVTEQDLNLAGHARHGTGEATLGPEGIDKLDRFMARNPGAMMTIEITGEPPIRRAVYGRVWRGPAGWRGQTVTLTGNGDPSAAHQPGGAARRGAPRGARRGPGRGMAGAAPVPTTQATEPAPAGKP
jgi:hypothetical protein